MEKYNKLLSNIAELIEKGLFTSKSLKKDLDEAINLKMEIVTNKLNLVSREEFEVQKKLIIKLQKELIIIKSKKLRNLRKDMTIKTMFRKFNFYNIKFRIFLIFKINQKTIWYYTTQ